MVQLLQVCLSVFVCNVYVCVHGMVWVYVVVCLSGCSCVFLFCI